ncbi:11047_t:CDS:2 [Funneliformis geosporum]|nr:11047_t:CDS:2 [Funneliformis geosporum]
MNKNAKVKAENAKLRYALEEHEAKFMRLDFVENPNNIVHLDKLEKMANPLNTSDSTFNSNIFKPIQTSLRNHDENESNTKTVNIVINQEKILLEDSVQKMPERLNGNVSQRESDSGLKAF